MHDCKTAHLSQNGSCLSAGAPMNYTALTAPAKRIAFVLLWRMKKRKGLLQTIVNFGDISRPRDMTTAVAAAAVVPSSSTSTKVLWITSSICRLTSDMAPKSASALKATCMPREASSSLTLPPNSALKRGSFSMPFRMVSDGAEACPGLAKLGHSAGSAASTSSNEAALGAPAAPGTAWPGEPKAENVGVESARGSSTRAE
mmetsp:Transcript_73549/g.215764  ORF Transcript_73549/g.215764 Transcript_73549/m.215764 type:complete len:201 (-) Transcript_73549:46-648(-)